MDEYSIEILIENTENGTLETFDINDNNKKEWRAYMEANALGEYYKRKIIISEQNF